MKRLTGSPSSNFGNMWTPRMRTLASRDALLAIDGGGGVEIHPDTKLTRLTAPALGDGRRRGAS